MEIIAMNGSAVIAPAADLQITLFDDFIKYIDRGECTTRTYLTNLRQFAAWLRYSCICRPVREDIVNYREYLAAEHEAIKLDSNSNRGWSYRTDSTGSPLKVICKPNTIAQYLRAVCQFFKWTAAEGLYPDIAANIHAPKIRHDAHKKEALSAADVLAIEKSIAAGTEERAAAAETSSKDKAGRMERATIQGKRLYAMYLLAVNAGLRTIEISRANVKDIEVKNGNAVLYVWGKGHSEADSKKPLAPEVYAAVREYLEARTDRYNSSSPLFVSTGNRSGGKRIATTTISTMLKNAMIEAGYNSERLTAHSLRHTAGTNVMEITGNNLYATQNYMRHSNPATTEIYLHNDTEKHETEIAQNLYNLYHGISVATGNKTQITAIIESMSAEQLEQLTSIAAMIANR